MDKRSSVQSAANDTQLTNVATWLSLSDCLLAVYREFHSVPLPRAGGSVSDVYLLAYSLLARASSNFSGILSLIRAALVVEARILVRSCFENSFYLDGLRRGGEQFIREMAAADAAGRDVRGQAILERKDSREADPIFDEEDKTKIRKFLRNLRKEWPQSRSIEPRKLLRDSPLSDAYLIYSQLSADAAHPSITSLERYVDRCKGTATLKFFEAPTNEELVDTITFGCLGSLGAFITGSEILQATALNEKIAVVAEEYNQLANPSESICGRT